MELEHTVDNRDFRTTWLWVTLPNGERAYIEVDPIDLVENAIDNLPENEQYIYRGLLRQLTDF